MISFIVIGKNEGWKLSKCFQGVFNTIKLNKLSKYEVIYVDSDSKDDSIDRAKDFEGINIIKLTGIANAAIARNIGEKISKGDVLFFIDGDMELNPEFLLNVYSEKTGLKGKFISGQLKNYNYNEKEEFLYNNWQYNDVLLGDKYYSTTGGIFLIERKLWEKIGGMDNRFKRGQDLELALRLAKNGYKILRKQETIANHYTIAYTHHSRLWKTLLSGDISYSSSFLFRKHICNRFIYSKIVRTYYTLISLSVFLLIAILLDNYFFLLLYFIVVFIKTLRLELKKFLRNIEVFVFYIIRDLFFIIYMFFPLKSIDDSNIKYKKIL